MNLHKTVFSYDRKQYKDATNEQVINDFNSKWNMKISQIINRINENEKNSMCRILENKRYEEYIELLKELKIVIPFPPELLNQMKSVYVSGKSLADHFKEWTTRGECHSMSVALSTLFLDQFIINKAQLKMPLITFEHQWLEYNGYVYDTTFHLIFPREIYYSLYCPENVHTLTNEEIDKIKNDIFNKIEVKPTNKR